MYDILNHGGFLRHINGYLTNQLPNSEKLESACAKIHFMLTLFAGELRSLKSKFE